MKKISVFFVIFALVIFAGYNVYKSSMKKALSDIALNNIEALATGDSSPGTHNHGPTAKPLLGKPYCKNTNQVDCSY